MEHKNADNIWFDHQIKTHWVAVKLYSIHLYQNPEQADEATGVVFEEVWRKRQQDMTKLPDNPAQMRVWLKKVLWRNFQDQGRWKQRHPEVSASALTAREEEIGDEIPDTYTATDPLKVLLEAEGLRAMECMDTLSEAHRKTLILYYEEERSVEDIAEICGTAIGTVKSRLHSARKSLGQCLSGKENPA